MSRRGRSAPRIAVVGAGLAGLYATFLLKRAGHRAVLYEAVERLGGRIQTARDLIGPGLTTELGGEFLDSDHDDMFGLVRLLGLQLRDLKYAPGVEGYHFGGRNIPVAEMVAAFRRLAARIAADQRSIALPITRFQNNTPAARRLDWLSIDQYFERRGASGPLLDLLRVAYLEEYGLDTGDQSALNFITQIITDPDRPFSLYGESDERYVIQGGNHQVIELLAAQVADQIAPGSPLLALRQQGSRYLLNFGGPAGEVVADFVILALPFTALRQVELALPMPNFKRQAIDQLGYGTNTKLVAGFRDRPWLAQGYNGDLFTDLPLQSGFESTQLQPGQAAGFTIFLGGAAGLAAGQGTATEQAARLLPGLEQVWPGSLRFLNGTFARAFWPGMPFINASYACYRPGQYTTIAGVERMPLGNVFFAGEHCSIDFQGYMNGAARTGRMAAVAVLNRINA